MSNSRLGLQMPIKTDIHNPEANAQRDSVHPHTLSPIPHRSGSGPFGSTLPSLESRYNTSSYEHSPSPASTTSLYSHYHPYQQSGYPASTSPYSPSVPSLVSSYPMPSEPSRSRIPSMHSPVSQHSSSSIRSAYTTTTPHISRHHHRSAKDVHVPHSPLPTSRSMRSPTMTTSPTMVSQVDSDSTSSAHSGPPMGSTHVLCNLYSADGVLVEPEIHGRVEKGFFLADRDWTCYRRNYFTVVCSYSLKPATHSLPFYLKRSPAAQAENVLAFAMCISAVVDAPGGKTVELVQHTPKRDKGPQHKPSKVKLAPQPIGGLAFNAGHVQNTQANEFSPFPQQTQQQNVASFERIQFKSATANNGKRRAAQQYYHLIVELYADVGCSNSATPGGASSEAGWVKIAYKTSAPMVVRGRSPGHYADERRVQSPGGNNGSGNGNTQSPTSIGNGGNMMGGSDIGASSDVLGSNRLSVRGMDSYHNVGNYSAHTSPSPSSIRDPPIATPPPPTQMDGPPIDPTIITGDDGNSMEPDFPGYHYYPGPMYPGQHSSHIYEPINYPDERKPEGPVVTHCTQFDNDIASYGTTMIRGKCAPYRDSADGSRGYYPDLPTV